MKALAKNRPLFLVSSRPSFRSRSSRYLFRTPFQFRSLDFFFVLFIFSLILFFFLFPPRTLTSTTASNKNAFISTHFGKTHIEYKVRTIPRSSTTHFGNGSGPKWSPGRPPPFFEANNDRYTVFSIRF